MLEYQAILEDFAKIANIKTRDIDLYNKRLIRAGTDVSSLGEHIIAHQQLHRTYFQVSLGQLKSADEQFEFIERNEDYLQDWWHVDQLTQFIKKPIDFDFAYQKAQAYVNSSKTFTRRWGYVLFLTGLQEESKNTAKILSLMKDDEEYYVRMAEAWLICDLAVFNSAETISFIENSRIRYDILGKAIQKMCDSYRISSEDKEYVKSLRQKLKNN